MIGLNHVAGATLFKKMTLATTSALPANARPRELPVPDLLKQVCWFGGHFQYHRDHFEYFVRVGRQTVPYRLEMDFASQRAVQVRELGEALSIKVSDVTANIMDLAVSQLERDLLEAAGAASGGEKLAFIWYQPLAGDTGCLTIAIRDVENGTVVG